MNATMRTVTPSCRTSTSGRSSSTPGSSLIASTSRAPAAKDPVRKYAFAPSPSTRQSSTPSASRNCFGLIFSIMRASLSSNHCRQTLASACPAGRRASSGGGHRDERLHRTTLVHRGVRLRDAVEVGLEVENASWLDATMQYVIEELGDVLAHRRDAAAQPDVAEEQVLDRHLDAMRNADIPNDRARSCDGERGRHRLAGADALECGIDTDPTGELENCLDRRVAPLGDDVRRAEGPCKLLPCGIATESDDASRSQPAGRDDGAEAHGAVADDRHDAVRPNAGAHRDMVTRAHHIGQREQRAHCLVRVIRAGDAHESRIRERHTNHLALTSIYSAISERAASDAVRCPPSPAVGARSVVERERCDDEIALGDHVNGRSDLLDDSDELVADRPEIVR